MVEQATQTPAAVEAVAAQMLLGQLAQRRQTVAMAAMAQPLVFLVRL
jgi:hypothetical protein